MIVNFFLSSFKKATANFLGRSFNVGHAMQAGCKCWLGYPFPNDDYVPCSVTSVC